MSIYDLAEMLGVSRDSEELAAALRQLEQHGRIRYVMGVRENGMVCRFALPVEGAR